jgi:hypothetical protein
VGLLTSVQLERRQRNGVNRLGLVVGVLAVLGEALVGMGNGRSDPSTWMASATVFTRRVNGVRAGGRRWGEHSGGGAWLT